ncbi:ArsR family transcriptional regulator [Archaeoglobus sp.]
MELTFRDRKIAQSVALNLIKFGRVRIERCYRLKDRFEVVYKLYLDNLWADDDLIEAINKHSEDFEEDFEEVVRFLKEKNRVLKDILSLLETPKSVEEICSALNLDKDTISSLLDDLEEEGYVVNIGERFHRTR